MEKKNIYETITAVMSDIGAVGKNSKNIQQGFMFRGIDAVMNAMNPAMLKHKLFLVPEVLEQTREERRSVKEYRDNTGKVQKKESVLIYSICEVRYTFYAEDGSFVQAVTVGEGMDSGDKATNKAMSNAFKYACFQVFCIPTEEMQDPDSESHQVEPKTATKEIPQRQDTKQERWEGLITHQQKAEVLAELGRTGVGLNNMLMNYGLQNLDGMTMKDAEDAIGKLRKMPAKKVEKPKEAPAAAPALNDGFENIDGQEELPFT